MTEPNGADQSEAPAADERPTDTNTDRAGVEPAAAEPVFKDWPPRLEHKDGGTAC